MSNLQDNYSCRNALNYWPFHKLCDARRAADGHGRKSLDSPSYRAHVFTRLLICISHINPIFINKYTLFSPKNGNPSFQNDFRRRTRKLLHPPSAGWDSQAAATGRSISLPFETHKDFTSGWRYKYRRGYRAAKSRVSRKDQIFLNVTTKSES